MTDDHVHGVFDLPKRAGCCLCCGDATYTILGTTLDGTPNRLGPMLPDGVQVTFLMSDGTEADVTFCVACARALRPADYPRVWDRVVDAVDHAAARAQRRPVERRLLVRPYLTLWPLAILRWRRESAELSRLVVDRRRTEVVA